MGPVGFSKKLVTWFHKHKEDFFFRKNRTPYTVWISEVALQQTRVGAALEPIKRFFDHFESLEALAAADEDDVIRAFQGLGYYNRARNLSRGAKALVADHGGRFPERATELEKIPSIGPYTAAAIASICFNERVPVIDGNVRRVMSRVLNLEIPVQDKKFDSEIISYLHEEIEEPGVSPGNFNEAIMQLGQKVCIKGKPLCDRCPVQNHCAAFKAGTTTTLPVMKEKKAKIDCTWRMLLIENQKGQVLFDQPEDFYFLKGHPVFPSRVELPGQHFETANYSQKKQLPVVKRHTSITHHRVSIELQTVMTGAGFSPRPASCWVDKNQVESFIAASALLKTYQQLKKQDA